MTSCQSAYRNVNQIQLNTMGLIWGKQNYRINNIPVNDSLYRLLKIGDKVKLRTLYENHRYDKDWKYNRVQSDSSTQDETNKLGFFGM